MTTESRLRKLALRRLIRRNLGLLTTSALALTAPAFAQTASDGAQSAKDGDAEDVGEVVVTGIRRQLETSQARKQTATELVDAITADDIGALPDRSVTEVLQRIPGLAIGRVPAPRDADRIAIEGSGVTIRGLSWVRSELNGHTAFSAKNSRTLGFEDIPPELLAGVDVYKNPSAQQVEGGLSGTVNLRTRLPFDSEGSKFGFSLEEAQGDLAKKWEPSGSALVSGRTTISAGNSELGEIGALLSVSSSELTSKTDTVHIEKYYARTDLVPGQTIYATGGIGWRELTIDRKRTGASAALQWKSPNDKVDASLQYFYSKATFDQDENAVWNLPGGGFNGTGLEFDGDKLVGGTFFDGGSPTAGSGYSGSARYNQRETRNDDLSFHLNWAASDRLHFEGDVQYSTASTKIIDLTMGPSAGPSFQNLGPYQLELHGSGVPTIVIPASTSTALSDPNMIFHNFAMDHHEDNDADAWAYRADADYTFDNSDWLDKVRFGVRYEDYNSTTRETGYRWGSISQNWGGGPAIFGAQNVPFLQQNYSNWFHGGAGPASFLFPNTNFFRNFQQWSDTVVDVSTAAGVNNGCCTWVPWDGDYSTKFPANDGLGVNPQNQRTTAAYTQLSFKHEKWDGNVGIRFVKTEAAGSGQLVFSGGNFGPGAPASDVAFANGASTPTSGDNSYNNVLPSFNLRYKATDNLFFRFAVAKGIARPEFAQLLPSITVNVQVGQLAGGVCVPLPSNVTVGNCVSGYNGYAGNAELEPMDATNYDLSTEWYINETNSLTFALFDKQVSGFIETTLGNIVPYTNNGVTKDVTVLRPENQGNGYVRGAELAWNGFFDFLPGWGKSFGARAAYTYVKSGGTRNAAVNPYDPNQQTNSLLQDYPLEGLSKTSYNAELYYSIPKFEARLAYNWRERYLLTTAAANLNIPAFADDYGQLDASLQWKFQENMSFGLEAVNLTRSKFKILVDNDVTGGPGNGAGLTYHNWVDSDRRITLFLRANF
ncbi:MAG TPA: TonB-dependent receptor [Steroidobacteraceae bacterium]|jgi:TonB-dependent receptor|nr:TonB-dependent receptor [Steroidobacteraceae bacterium]